VARGLHLSSTPSATSTQIESVLHHLPQYEALGVKFLLTPGTVTLPAGGARGLRRVFAGPSGEVFEVPHPSAFYSAGSGGCRVVSQHFDTVRLRCKRASTLVRRELPMPGWTATVNGTARPVGADSAFQTVHVPAGTSTVTFRFTPPYETAALVAFVAGMLVLAALVVVARREGRAPRVT
jgi:hypothetical protein